MIGYRIYIIIDYHFVIKDLMGFNKMKKRYAISFNFFVKTYLRSTCSPRSTTGTWVEIRNKVCVNYLLKMISVFFICSHIYVPSSIYVKNCLFLYFISFTFGALTIFDQAFVKSIKSWQDEHVRVCCEFLKG